MNATAQKLKCFSRNLVLKKVSTLNIIPDWHEIIKFINTCWKHHASDCFASGDQPLCIDTDVNISQQRRLRKKTRACWTICHEVVLPRAKTASDWWCEHRCPNLTCLIANKISFYFHVAHTNSTVKVHIPSFAP